MTPAPVILALDTASDGCAVGIYQAGTTMSSRRVVMARGQSEALMPMIGECLTTACIGGMAGLNAIAVTIGPGAFTGVRIGLAAARGLGLAAALPVIGVTTFEAIAADAPEPETRTGALMVALESRRDDVFVQIFRGATGLAPCSLAPGALADFVTSTLGPDHVMVAGNAAARMMPLLTDRHINAELSQANPEPETSRIAALAALRWRPGERPPVPGPLYLRKPDAVPDLGALRPS